MAFSSNPSGKDQSLANGTPQRLGLSVSLPAWVWSLTENAGARQSQEARMDLVLELAAQNVAEGGAPFAAGVFDADGNIVGPGVNRVVVDSAPIAHGEIVAIAVAGQRLGTWNLKSRGEFELVSSTEPCAMCLGAVPWSGVKRLVVGARDEDARAVGFDEGDKPADWPSNLAERGIDVVTDVRRTEAAEILENYLANGGTIYNGASNGAS